MLTILLVRHGECLMNLELADKVGGRANSSPLTALGERQSRAMGNQMRRVLAARGVNSTELSFFSSTAVRALDTARIMLDTLELPATPARLITTDRLLEQEMGEFGGQKRSNVYTPETMAKIDEDCHNFKSPGGESQREVEERMLAYIWEEVLPRTRPGEPSVVVGHGMAFKCVLRHIMSSDARMTRKIALKNTSITEIGFVPEDAPAGMQRGWHIMRVNDAAHLMLEGLE